MPTLREILQEKEDRLESVPTGFTNSVDRSQKEILKALVRLVDDLSRTKGAIDITPENIGKIQQIAEQLLSVIFTDTEYKDALSTFSKEFNTQAKITRRYMTEIQQDFENKEIYKANLALSQRQAIELLARSGVSQAFINPMKDILQASVTSGSSFADTVDVLTDYILGTKQREGALLHHAKQVAFDGFAFADRQYVKVISEDLGFEFFQYFGGRIKDSRFFCSTRANQVFHKKEIKDWGDHPDYWNAPPASPFHGGGRIPETTENTIWTYAGGYNCRHQIAPLSRTNVPKDVMERAIKKGYVK